MKQTAKQENKAVELQHDGMITVATGNSRVSKSWKPQQMLWSQLVSRLSKTNRTGETIEEYKRMSKADQDRIKDVGGFVGGVLSGGRRTADAVKWRHVVTLDADFPADTPLWDEYELMVGKAGLIYSTHKHEPTAPRLRLVIPLSRAVNPDEYQAVSRRIAGWLGIDQFDDTTYQAHRLMYWPSTSRNGEFVFQYLDGEWVDPDEILATYTDWTDAVQWPESSRRASDMKRMANKQGDPEDKPGVIGAFCRTYDIGSAIETFIPDQYVSAGEDRFSYTGGSTAAGAVVYDDKFLYSHHGTDPVGGRLVNAFDLIRIHLFGEEDIEASSETPVNKLPSFQSMSLLAAGDKNTKKTILTERIRNAQEEFGEILEHNSENVPESVPLDLFEDDDEWLEKLDMTAKGKVKESIGNAVTILERDPLIRSTFGLNEFTGRVNLRKNLPWRRKEDGLLWSDVDDADLRHYMELGYNHTHKGNIEAAFTSVTRKNRFHPVREYLNGLVWDGTARIESLLIDYLGASDNEYVRAVTRKTLVAAVARIMEPGAKFDHMLTLVGKQGVGKSTLFNILAGEWFSDSFHTFQGKEAYEQLQGAWIVEIAELAATKKADVESMKQFITKRVDSYRQAYGRHITEFKRQSIFIGTTNDYEFLQDRTGNRRFWVIEVGVEPTLFSMWDDLNRDEVNQIWAEAVYYYKEGEELRLPPEIEALAAEAQHSHVEGSPIEGMIQEYLEIPITEDWYEKTIQARRQYIQAYNIGTELTEIGEVRRDRVCAIEIWLELMEGRKSDFPIRDKREINQILGSLPGWKRPDTGSGKQRFGNEYGIQKAYLRDI